jgi:hypothetical protein
MKKLARNFKGDSNDGNLSKVRYSIVAANNHYAGFGPGTVNIFRQLLGLEEMKWGDEYISKDDLVKDDDSSVNKRVIKTKQTSHQDYTNDSSRLNKRVCLTFCNKNCFILNLQDGLIIRTSNNLVVNFLPNISSNCLLPFEIP